MGCLLALYSINSHLRINHKGLFAQAYCSVLPFKEHNAISIPSFKSSSDFSNYLITISEVLSRICIGSVNPILRTERFNPLLQITETRAHVTPYPVQSAAANKIEPFFSLSQ